MLPEQTGLPANTVPSEAPAQVPQAETAGQEPKYVTREEAERMAEEAFRKAQRLVDQSNSRLAKQINETVANVKQGLAIAGQAPLTPEQEEALRQKVALQTIVSEAPQSTPETSQQGAGEADWVNATAARIAAQVGGIEDNDPEARMIITDQSPTDYIMSVQQAVTAKQARIASKQTTLPPVAGIPAANFTTGGNPVDNRPPRDLIAEGLKN